MIGRIYLALLRRRVQESLCAYVTCDNYVSHEIDSCYVEIFEKSHAIIVRMLLSLHTELNVEREVANKIGL